MILLSLFLSFLQIGLLSFGGGYAALPLIQEQIINIHHWLDMSEFTDLIAISQMTPGPIAINAATFIGLKIADLPGALIATLGCVIPSCFIVTILAYLYKKYQHLSLMQNLLKTLRPAVVAMIASGAIAILQTCFFQGEASLSTFRFHMVIIFFTCVYLLKKKDMNPIMVMVIAGVMNVMTYGFYMIL